FRSGRLERIELRLAARLDPILALEAHREAEVHELEQIEVGAGLTHQVIEDLEKLLAAPAFAVEYVEQRAARPLALAAPRRVEHGLVDQRAERVARGEHVLVVHARGGCRRLEGLDL